MKLFFKVLIHICDRFNKLTPLVSERPMSIIDAEVVPSSVAHWPSSSLCWHQNLCRSNEQRFDSGTEVSQTLVQKYGTVCRLHSDSPA